MFKNKFLLSTLMLLFLVMLVGAAYKTDIYDYDGQWVRSKVNYSLLGADNVTAAGYFLGDGSLLTGVSTGTNLTEIELYFVNRTDWTTIDDYPSACGANTYVTAIGDTLTCNAVTSFAYSDWFNQFLNTTDAPVFAGLNSTGNVSVGDGASAFTMQTNGSNVLFDSGTDYDIVSSVNITAPVIYTPNGAMLYDYNATCVILLSPAGTGNITVCD